MGYQKNIQRIFDPFFTTKPTERGTGLGLSVVHGIATQAQGFIEVDSREGAGTEVRVCLPMCKKSERVQIEEQQQNHQLRGNELILLADDDDDVRFVLTEMLQEAGYQVISCSNGVEAIDQFNQHEQDISIVVSDTVMPQLGGRGLYDALIAKRPDLPFLFCSGYAETLSKEFLMHPRRDFIGKPFTNKKLLSKVAGLLIEQRNVTITKDEQTTNLQPKQELPEDQSK